MSEQPYRRHEKEEKNEEKKRDDEEKQEEKHEEKQWDEKWRRDPLNGIIWAGILVWAGLVLLADNLGYLHAFAFLNAWGLIFAGAGLILLLETAFRFLVPSYRQFVMGKLILALVFLGIGLGNLLGCAATGAFILIAIGVVILLGTLVWWRR
jgi:cation transport ATPase